MADNPSVYSGTAGSAIPVAADEVTVFGGAAVVQLVKVTDGTEAGTAGAKVTAADGLYTFQTNSGTVAGTVTVANASIAVTQSTSPWVTSATVTNTGTVTGTVVVSSLPSVTVGNSTGGAAVNIQDGGNSITIDGAVSVNTGTVVGTVTATPSGTYTTKETRSTASTIAGVAAATSSGTILATNANRLGATVYNASTALMQLSLAGTASNSASLYTAQLLANDYFETPGNYTGPITANWAAANGSALVTELS